MIKQLFEFIFCRLVKIQNTLEQFSQIYVPWDDRVLSVNSNDKKIKSLVQQFGKTD